MECTSKQYQVQSQLLYLKSLSEQPDMERLKRIAFIKKGVKEKKLEYEIELPQRGMTKWDKERKPIVTSFKTIAIEKDDFEKTYWIGQDALLFHDPDKLKRHAQSMAGDYAFNMNELISMLITLGFTTKCWTGSNFYGEHKITGDMFDDWEFTNLLTYTLCATGFRAARSFFRKMKDINGKPLFLNLTKDNLILKIPEALESTAESLFDMPDLAGGGKNPLYNKCKWEIDPYLNDTPTKWTLNVDFPNEEKPFIGFEVDKKAGDVSAVGLPRFLDGKVPGDEYKEAMFGINCMHGAGFGMPWLSVGSTGAVNPEAE